jgi:XTP/dITP diphosphohydrolase
MDELVLATTNKGKIAELTALLSPINCIPQHTLGITATEETSVSFVENAIAKARHVSRITGKPALADDSGLVVNALQGQPGIYSARFAGTNATDEQNTVLLLHKLSELIDANRSAYFYCAIVILQHADDPTPLIATGILHGSILQQPIGSSGFGYDPIFYVPSMQCSLAQLDTSIKNTISHRAQALNKLRNLITR